MTKRFEIVTVQGEGGPPSLAEAAVQSGVSVEDLNAEYGVVVIDPEKDLYAIEVDAEAVQVTTGDGTYRGPFSNPRIEHFGPIQPAEDDAKTR